MDPLTLDDLAWILLTSGLIVIVISIPRFFLGAFFASRKKWNQTEKDKIEDKNQDLWKELLESFIGLMLVALPWIYVFSRVTWPVRLIILIIFFLSIAVLAFGGYYWKRFRKNSGMA
jgi:hypothetical protein